MQKNVHHSLELIESTHLDAVIKIPGVQGQIHPILDEVDQLHENQT